MLKKLLKYGSGAFVIALMVAQFIRPETSNPASEPSASFVAVAKPSADTVAVVGRACRDCHSNETVWPWYSQVAPASWLIARDVKQGRAKLNFSRWNIYSPEMTRIKMGEICEEVRKGEMPPGYYLPMHPEAKVTPADVSAVCAVPLAALR